LKEERMEGRQKRKGGKEMKDEMVSVVSDIFYPSPSLASYIIYEQSGR
jgi:hypothetical protein